MGAAANIAEGYATKRYRSNCINWGMIPFVTEKADEFRLNDYVFVPCIREAILNGVQEVKAYIISEKDVRETTLKTGELSETERAVLADGCLINYYRNKL